jgi:hypothetical protein
MQGVGCCTPVMSSGATQTPSSSPTMTAKMWCHPCQSSTKLLSIFDRLGCFSFRSALASIWRIRSRDTEN